MNKQDHKLTARECEVLTLFADGFTMKEIAGLLFISQHTVDTHRSNITRKLQGRNITHAVALGIRGGLV